MENENQTKLPEYFLSQIQGKDNVTYHENGTVTIPVPLARNLGTIYPIWGQYSETSDDMPIMLDMSNGHTAHGTYRNYWQEHQRPSDWYLWQMSAPSSTEAPPQSNEPSFRWDENTNMATLEQAFKTEHPDLYKNALKHTGLYVNFRRNPNGNGTYYGTPDQIAPIQEASQWLTYNYSLPETQDIYRQNVDLFNHMYNYNYPYDLEERIAAMNNADLFVFGKSQSPQYNEIAERFGVNTVNRGINGVAYTTDYYKTFPLATNAAWYRTDNGTTAPKDSEPGVIMGKNYNTPKQYVGTDSDTVALNYMPGKKYYTPELRSSIATHELTHTMHITPAEVALDRVENEFLVPERENYRGAGIDTLAPRNEMLQLAGKNLSKRHYTQEEFDELLNNVKEKGGDELYELWGPGGYYEKKLKPGKTLLDFWNSILGEVAYNPSENSQIPNVNYAKKGTKLIKKPLTKFSYN